MDRSGPAKSNERKFAGVASTLGRHSTQRPHHRGIGDLGDAIRGLEWVQPQGHGKFLLYCGPGSAPALCGPTRSAPPLSIQAILPPPAPTSTISNDGARSACPPPPKSRV